VDNSSVNPFREVDASSSVVFAPLNATGGSLLAVEGPSFIPPLFALSGPWTVDCWPLTVDLWPLTQLSFALVILILNTSWRGELGGDTSSMA
jgi:hypothetical protein